MNPALRRLHLAVGVAGLIAFLATGLYMDRVHEHLRGYEDTQRLLFRSTHIYLLLAAISNVLLGLYVVPASPGSRRVVQAIGSLALLAAPMMFLAAFATEPWLTDLARPWTRPAVILTFAGAVLHLVASWPAQVAPRAETFGRDQGV